MARELQAVIGIGGKRIAHQEGKGSEDKSPGRKSKTPAVP